MSGSSTRRSSSGIPQPPLASFGILKTAIGSEFDTLDQGELSRRVYAGVLLTSNEGQGELQGQPYTHKYWVDGTLNKSCWIVLAKALSITSSDNGEYWKWTKEEGELCYQGPKEVLIAELSKISCLDISGTCKTTTLSPKTAYQVEIMVKMRPQSYGWDAPVTLSLTVPDGYEQKRVEYLKRLGLEKEQWTPITIGTFETTPRTVGEIRFSLTQTDGHWKSGLLVKGVQLTPLL